MNISFVYPIYNEIENLPRLLPETERIAQGLFDDYEAVLVDDGSTDGSGRFISQLAAENPRVKALHHARNRGLGAAIRTGLANATQDIVLYMDSDFPVTAEEARKALGALAPDADMLIGYRLGRAEGPRREIMSWTYNRLIRWTFGLRVRDVNFAFKVMRRSLLERMRLCSEGSFIDAEMLLEAQRLGARIQEVGLPYHPRVAGVSTAASMKVVWGILRELRKYRRERGEAAGTRRAVIFNADDFGLCAEVNQGIARAHDQGVVTSASLLATGDAFAEAVEMAGARPDLDLGVHLALTQLRPALPPEEVPSLVEEDGRFAPTWSAFAARYLTGRVNRREIEAEWRAQIARVKNEGLPISHLDSHQHLHLLPGLLPIAARLAAEFGIRAMRYPNQRSRQPVERAGGSAARRWAEGAALRGACRMAAGMLRRNGLVTPDGFRGFAEAGAWDATALARTVSTIEPGVTEIGCHPGIDDAIAGRFPWGYHWERELAALTSDELAAALRISGAETTTYRELVAEME